MAAKPARLYAEHLARLQQMAESALADSGHHGMIIHSGEPYVYFRDDQEATFRETAHFAHWLPLSGPHHWLIIRPGERPKVIRCAPKDFWYETTPLGDPFWLSHLDLEEVGSAEQAHKVLPAVDGYAFIGENAQLAAELGFAPASINSPALEAALNWARSFKSGYEVACLELATERGLSGHEAARAAFYADGSELDIHHAYLRGLVGSEVDLPYATIVGLDEKAAFLHYTGKRTMGNGRLLLIDAGARHLGYACDITRSWAKADADPLFVAMLEAFAGVQLRLCDEVVPGKTFGDLQWAARAEIAALLHDVGVLSAQPELALELGLTRPFFPHGLGHFLGLQVHDVGGRQAGPNGGVQAPPEVEPSLRTTRTLAEGLVLTIEPGLYFIPLLLEPFRSSEHRNWFDWDLIERLTPLGGMRIEDNVLVTAQAHRNITREVAAAMPA